MPTSTLSIHEFGRQLIKSRDLDPVYVVLYHAELPEPKLCEFLVAYWCFYHLGTASWIVDQRDYWQALFAAASTKEHPRSSERRHFRGQQAIKAVEELRGLRQSCSELVTGLQDGTERPSFPEVAERVKSWRGFGDWIAFKVADMIERLGIFPVRFSYTDVFNMFESPRLGAEQVILRHGPSVGEPYTWVYKEVKKNLAGLSAPPRYERAVNIQEIETCLCKWKSHLSGRYEVGKDIEEVHHSLLRYQQTPTARLLLKAGHIGELW